MHKISANSGRSHLPTVLFLTVLCALGACAGPTPSVTYTDVSATLFPAPNVAPPATLPLQPGEIIYALRTTDVTLFPSGYKTGDDVASTGRSDACAADPNAKAAEKAKRAGDIAKDPRDCLKDITAVPTPAAYERGVYVVTPEQPFQVQIQLSTTPTTTDPLLTTSVTVSYTDNRKQYFTNIGTAAAAGFVFGPAGAIAGGIIAAGIPVLTQPQVLPGAGAHDLYLSLICPDDAPYWDDATAQQIKAVSLNLPVTLPLVPDGDSAEKSNPLLADNDPTNCWHPLPKVPTEWKASLPNRTAATGTVTRDPAKFSALTKDLTTGWLYRFVAPEAFAPQFGGSTINDAHSPLANMAIPSGSSFAISAKTSLLPVTPCETAVLELIWWGAAESQLEQHFKGTKPTGTDIQKYPLDYAASPPMQVANPHFVQPLTLPKGGAINFGTVCGATVSYTNSAGTLDQNLEALISAASAIKTAQEAYKKSQ